MMIDDKYLDAAIYIFERAIIHLLFLNHSEKFNVTIDQLYDDLGEVIQFNIAEEDVYHVEYENGKFEYSIKGGKFVVEKLNSNNKATN